MEPIYILFVCAGGVFTVLFFALAFESLEHWKRNSHTKRDILKMYGDSNLAKMEYDLAFYDGDLYSRRNRNDSAKQVTIEDMFREDGGDREEEDELTRFYPIAEAGEQVVVGHYDPESADE